MKSNLYYEPLRVSEETLRIMQLVTLAYMTIRKLYSTWVNFDLTVKEGLKQLSTICSTEMIPKGHGSCLKILRSRELLKAVNVRMSIVLTSRRVYLVTGK